MKFKELQIGDLVMAEFDDTLHEGEVCNVDWIDRKACVRTDEGNEFWYDMEHLKPILLDESQLFKLGFQKQTMPDGGVKYMKGAFRVLLHKPGDFSTFEMWYREDQRHIVEPMYVHEFQNKYLAMTKIVLTREAVQ